MHSEHVQLVTEIPRGSRVSARALVVSGLGRRVRLRHDVTAIAARAGASCCTASEGESETHGSNGSFGELFFDAG